MQNLLLKFVVLGAVISGSSFIAWKAQTGLHATPPNVDSSEFVSLESEQPQGDLTDADAEDFFVRGSLPEPLQSRLGATPGFDQREMLSTSTLVDVTLPAQKKSEKTAPSPKPAEALPLQLQAASAPAQAESMSDEQPTASTASTRGFPGIFELGRAEPTPLTHPLDEKTGDSAAVANSLEAPAQQEVEENQFAGAPGLSLPSAAKTPSDLDDPFATESLPAQQAEVSAAPKNPLLALPGALADGFSEVLPEKEEIAQEVKNSVDALAEKTNEAIQNAVPPELSDALNQFEAQQEAVQNSATELAAQASAAIEAAPEKLKELPLANPNKPRGYSVITPKNVNQAENSSNGPEPILPESLSGSPSAPANEREPNTLQLPSQDILPTSADTSRSKQVENAGLGVTATESPSAVSEPQSTASSAHSESPAARSFLAFENQPKPRPEEEVLPEMQPIPKISEPSARGLTVSPQLGSDPFAVEPAPAQTTAQPAPSIAPQATRSSQSDPFFQNAGNDPFAVDPVPATPPARAESLQLPAQTPAAAAAPAARAVPEMISEFPLGTAQQQAPAQRQMPVPSATPGLPELSLPSTSSQTRAVDPALEILPEPTPAGNSFNAAVPNTNPQQAPGSFPQTSSPSGELEPTLASPSPLQSLNEPAPQLSPIPQNPSAANQPPSHPFADTRSTGSNAGNNGLGVTTASGTPPALLPFDQKPAVTPTSGGNADSPSAPGLFPATPRTEPMASLGPQTPELKIEKVAPPEAVIGEPLVYAIVIRNVGGSEARDVVVEDRIPRGTDLEGTIPVAYLTEGKLIWNLGTLAPGQEERVQLKVIPREAGEIGSVATVSFASTVTASIRVTAPELSISMQGPDEAILGEKTKFRFTLKNDGQGPAKNVFLRAILPEGLRHPGGNDLEYEVGLLPPGASKDIELTIIPEQEGIVTPRAMISNDSKTYDETQSDMRVIRSRLAINRSGPSARFVGRPGVFTTTVTNESSQTLNNVTIQESIPVNCELAAIPQGGRWDPTRRIVTWVFNQLQPQETQTLTLQVVTSMAGEHRGSVIAQDASGNRSELATNLDVKGFADLKVQTAKAHSTVAVGDQVSLRMTIKNDGSAPAKNVRTRFVIPSNLEFVSAKGPVQYDISGNVVEFASLNEVPIHGENAFDIVLTAAHAGATKVSVQLESADYEQPLISEESIRILPDR